MKKNRTSIEETEVMSLRPPAVQHYFGEWFAEANRREWPADEYDVTLARTAARLAEHGRRALQHGGWADDAAGLLRDAARLADLLAQRRNARFELEEQTYPRRKAARS